MNRLWTPWRMEYVGRGKSDGPCIFEAGGESPSDPEGLILFRNRLVVCALNRFPYANGHLLVAPAAHKGDLTELTPDEERALMAAIRISTGILRNHLRPDGFNIGLNLGFEAGAGIPDHLHFHLVPRWRGDHNFMTTVADARTIPEHISATFARLAPDFAKSFADEGA